MLALFALGIMSVFWMAVAAAAILVEKTLPRGEALARALAVSLVALGAWIAVSPRSRAGTAAARISMHMQMGMQP